MRGRNIEHLAKHLRLVGSDTYTLNYNIRAWPKGCPHPEFLAVIRLLPAVSAAAPDVMKMVSFTEANRYSDFKLGADKVAAVGIGGLIAGKSIANTGLLVTRLLVL